MHQPAKVPVCLRQVQGAIDESAVDAEDARPVFCLRGWRISCKPGLRKATMVRRRPPRDGKTKRRNNHEPSASDRMHFDESKGRKRTTRGDPSARRPLGKGCSERFARLQLCLA
eukprot:scaffold287_cov337-Pavlova_lutheri.AAC.80